MRTKAIAETKKTAIQHIDLMAFGVLCAQIWWTHCVYMMCLMRIHEQHLAWADNNNDNMHKHTANAAHRRKECKKGEKQTMEKSGKKQQIKTRMSVLKIFQAKEKTRKIEKYLCNLLARYYINRIIKKCSFYVMPRFDQMHRVNLVAVRLCGVILLYSFVLNIVI